LVFNIPNVWAVAGYSLGCKLAVANAKVSISFAATPKLLKMPFVAAGCNLMLRFLQIYRFYQAAAGYSRFLHISDAPSLFMASFLLYPNAVYNLTCNATQQAPYKNMYVPTRKGGKLILPEKVVQTLA
jgi:hypothetical protein